jgi:hypothetical protein
VQQTDDVSRYESLYRKGLHIKSEYHSTCGAGFILSSVETAVWSSGTLLILLASTAFSNVRGIIVDIPAEMILTAWEKRYRHHTLVEDAVLKTVSYSRKKWELMRSQLLLNAERCAEKPASLCRILIMASLIVHVQLVLICSCWSKQYDTLHGQICFKRVLKYSKLCERFNISKT